MRDWRRSLRGHWVALALILAYWALAFVVCAWQISTASADESGYVLQLFAPVVAGGLTAWSGGGKARAALLGALIGIVDFNVLVAIPIPHLPPSAVRQSPVVMLLISIPVFGGIGGALGFLGALAGCLFRRDRVESLDIERHN